MNFSVVTILGKYDCKSFTNIEPDEVGIDVSKNGDRIGSIIDISIPDTDDEDEMESFTNKLEIWLTENE